MTKTERQNIGIKTWRGFKGKGTLNYVPRFGKTEIANRTSKTILEKYPSVQIIAVAPNEITYKNLVNKLDGKVIVTTRARIINDEELLNSKPYLLIIDEIHRFLESQHHCILNIDAKFKLGLTGNKLDKKDKEILSKYGFPVIDTISEDDAIINNWISEYLEYNIGVEIEDYKKDLYVSLSDKISSILNTYKDCYKVFNNQIGFKLIDNDTDLMFALFGGKKYFDKQAQRFVTFKGDVIRNILAKAYNWDKDMPLETVRQKQIDDHFNPSNTFNTAVIFGRIVRERNSLIIDSKNKIEMAIEIYKANPVVTMIFNESTNMANLISNAIGIEAIEYHSAIETKFVIDPITKDYFRNKKGEPIKFGLTRMKKLAIEGINNGTFNVICTAKSLNEGLDIPKLQQIITTGGTTSVGTHLQRTARAKTIDPNNNSKIAIIINVYIKDFEYDGRIIESRDLQKLKQRQKDVNAYYVDTIEEIFVDSD